MPDILSAVNVVDEALLGTPVLEYLVDMTDVGAVSEEVEVTVEDGEVEVDVVVEVDGQVVDEVVVTDAVPAGEPQAPGFDFQALLFHHNLPYPAWEIAHHSPIIIFDLAAYSAKDYNIGYYVAKAEPGSRGSSGLPRVG